MKQEQIIQLITALRESADRMYMIFTTGSCVRLFKILQAADPSAKLYWSDGDSHALTKIDGNYYDIGGLVDKSYVRMREYRKIPPGNYQGYFLLKYSEVENIKTLVTVEKHFKTITDESI